MIYRDYDGMKRGKRGGLSSKNSSSAWAKYYGSPKAKALPESEPHPQDFAAAEEYQANRDIQEQRDYYTKRGYDPDDEFADIDMELDAEISGEY